MGQRRAGDDIRICAQTWATTHSRRAVEFCCMATYADHGRRADIFLAPCDRIPADQTITPGLAPHASSPSSTRAMNSRFLSWAACIRSSKESSSRNFTTDTGCF
jgi:hypothetical protein